MQPSFLSNTADLIKALLFLTSAVGVIWGAARWYSSKENTVTQWANRIESNHLTHIEKSGVENTEILREAVTELKVMNGKLDVLIMERK